MVILQAAVSSDATAIANKLSAAAAFFAAIDTDRERSGYAGIDAAASARAFVAAVSADPASLVAARLGAEARSPTLPARPRRRPQPRSRSVLRAACTTTSRQARWS